MDNLTHSLFALTLANAGLRRAGRGATAALVIASNIPDIEVLTTLTGGRVAYLSAHRGPTHGPLGLLLAVVTAGLVWIVQRAAGRREGAASLSALVGVSAVGVLGHITMDFATSYGTRVLSPFRDTWYGVDWMPIVDVYLWAVLIACLAAGVVRPALRARLAVAALAIMAGDYALRAGVHAVALRDAVASQALAVPASPARGGAVFHYLGTGDPADLPAAIPSLISPFRWRVIQRAPGGFEVRELDVFRPGDPGDRVTFPDDRSALVTRASSARLAQVFLDFSRFPAVETITHRNGDVTVHWYDLRFAERPTGPGDSRRHTSPFAVWVRLSPAGEIVGQGLGPG